ncbi:S8 family serine peptidase [Chitinophaga vietnamensis]|uniref:S8 family serine peptidase n=1 Tax=Chitinophaga vietnamensis TaxID=2593957 RepID=UPI0011782236|nr:S8 family serine peptidase [Chitinophaga vietnamensis]
MLKVGIIDSGVNQSGIKIPSDRITGVHFYKDENGQIISDEDINDLLGHGTACVATIWQYSNNIQFYMLRIFDEQWKADPDILVAAIAECISQQVDIINVSLGIESDQISAPLYEICRQAYNRHIPIIAAGRLDDKICFPACHPEVIGVGCLDLSAAVELVYMEHAAIDFYTKGEITFNGQLYFGTSFSCAKVTGEMVILMDRLPTRNVNHLKAALASKASQAAFRYPLKLPCAVHAPGYERKEQVIEKYFAPLLRYDFAQRVLVMPLYDEGMKAVFAAGVKACRGLIYQYWQHSYFANEVPSLIPPPELCATFDTIALGRLSSLLTAYNSGPVYQQIKLLLKKGKHFIVYDEADYGLLLELKAETKTPVQIALSLLRKEDLDDFRCFDDIQPLEIPVVATVGTSSGEIVSLQASLYRQLNNEGYDVAYIAPVAQGELLGADFSYSVNDAHLSDNDIETGKSLQWILKAVQHCRRPDLILTGLPGAVVPTDAPGGSSLAGLSFLKGIQPDALLIYVTEEVPVERIWSNYHTAIGLSGIRRCCFLLAGTEGNHRLAALYDLLTPFGIVLFQDTSGMYPGLEKVIRSFFSLQPILETT